MAATTLLTLAASSVYAQQTPECSDYVPASEQDDPSRLALRGVACFEAKQYLSALRHYRRARELSSSNIFDAAIGRTFQELGYDFIAQRYYRDYLASDVSDPESRAKIEQRLGEVQGRLDSSAARVRVNSTPPGAKLYVVVEEEHWEPLGVTPMDLQMRPGKHTFVVEQPGYVTHTQKVDVGSKQDRVVEASLVAEGVAIEPSYTKLQRVGLITMASSVPLLIVGPSLYFVGKNKRSSVDELPWEERPDATRSATSLQNVGIVATVTGVVALGTGAVLFLMGKPSAVRAEAGEAEASRWTPYYDGRSAGLVVSF